MNELMEDPRFQAAVNGIFGGLVEALREQGGMANGMLAIDALAFVQAAFLEAMPQAQGNGGLNKTAKAADEDLRAFLKVCRRTFENSGKHVLETLGAQPTKQ